MVISQLEVRWPDFQTRYLVDLDLKNMSLKSLNSAIITNFEPAKATALQHLYRIFSDLTVKL